jgi:hypothetical protein
MTSEQIDEYYQICLDSKKWERWVGNDFDFDNKRKLIQVCGHYCFGQYDLPKIDDIVKKNIKTTILNNHEQLPTFIIQTWYISFI